MYPSVGLRFPFTMTAVSAVLPDGGVATAVTSRYRIEVAPAGGPGFTIERRVSAVPLEDSEREEWEASLAAGASTARIAIPTHKPFIRRLRADSDGRIWVEIYVHATWCPRSSDPANARRQTRTWEEPNAYDVFDDRRRYLGRVDLLPFSRLLAVMGDRIRVTERTELGGSALVRYRMVMPRLSP